MCCTPFPSDAVCRCVSDAARSARWRCRGASARVQTRAAGKRPATRSGACRQGDGVSDSLSKNVGDYPQIIPGCRRAVYEAVSPTASPLHTGEARSIVPRISTRASREPRLRKKTRRRDRAHDNRTRTAAGMMPSQFKMTGGQREIPATGNRSSSGSRSRRRIRNDGLRRVRKRGPNIRE